MADAQSSATSVTLLELLKRNPRDEAAWAEFVRRYRPKIHGWCRERGLQEADADDVTQIVLAKLAEAMRVFQYDPARSFRAWLKTVTHNALASYVEQRQPGTNGGDVLDQVEARVELSQRLETAFDHELLERALERVRERVAPATWEAFRLTAMEGLSGAAAAQQLSMLVGQVFVAKHRVQKMLQEEIKTLEASADETGQKNLQTQIKQISAEGPPVMTFRQDLREFKLPLGTVWLMNDVAEAKGRQDLYTKQSPQILKALREMAMVQSVESSNRIEGVTVAADRLRPLVLGDTRPRDRSEEEIQGYRNALRQIHGAAQQMPIMPATLQDLHRTIQQGSGDAGQWKAVENDVIEFRPGEAPHVRFRTLAAQRVPAAMEETCLLYRHALDQQHVPALVAIACLVLDFLCIHPFRDGNGRVSRLLTVLALYHHGIEVVRYISLERLIEESKEDYYAVLQDSSIGWHEGKHNLLPWLNYFLAVLRRAYVVFEERAGRVKSPRGAKTALVTAAIEAADGPFTLGDLERNCPSVSRDMIRHILRNLQKEGRVECQGRGPAAVWRNKGNTLKKR